MKQASTKIKEADLLDLYKHYGEDSVEQFRAYCRKLVENARAPNPQILRSLDNMGKDQLLKTVNNFAMKGQGLGVL